MESKENFSLLISYLQKLGIITSESTKYINESITEIMDQSSLASALPDSNKSPIMSNRLPVSIITQITSIISKYITKISQSPEILNKISSNITINYIKFLSKNRPHILNKLFSIYNTKYLINSSLKKSKYFLKWRKLNHYLNACSSLKGLNSKKNICPKALRSNIYVTDSNNEVETSRQKKENEELKECTFKPLITSNKLFNKYKNISLNKNINNSNNFYSRQERDTVYERLYTDHQRITLRKQIRKNENEVRKIEESLFKPVMYNTPRIYASSLSKSFVERNKNYEARKEDEKNKLILSLENDYMSNYPFNPILNKNNHSQSKLLNYRNDKNFKKNNSSSNSLNRNDYYNRNKTFASYNLNSNTNCNYTNYINNNNNYGGTSDTKRHVDLKRIEHLYSVYKNKKKVIENIKTKMDSESGLTFEPHFVPCNNSFGRKAKNNAESFSFHERNENFIRNKNDFLEGARESQYDYQKGKKYTSKEKKEMVDKICNELYVKGLEKQLNRNGIKLNKKDEK